MLINYKIANYKSFYDEAELNMKPGKMSTRFKDNAYRYDSRNSFLKTSVIVGENAGGKTNFIDSLRYMKSLVSESSTIKANPEYLHQQYKENPQLFSLKYIGSDKRIYTYKLVLDTNSIIHESLYRQLRSQDPEEAIPIFTMDRISVDHSGENIKTEMTFNLNYLDENLRPSTKKRLDSLNGQYLTVKTLQALGVDECVMFIEWINNLEVIIPHKSINMVDGSLNKSTDFKQVASTDKFLEIFQLADSSITGIKIDDLRPLSDSIIERESSDGATVRLRLSSESSGIIDFFQWSYYIYKVIFDDFILFADEIDRVMNVVMADKVIRYVNAHMSKGQFIFTTHNVFHLNTVTFMKEQLNFVTKDNLLSDMYSLADFPDYRYVNTKVYELYLKGLLGGTPYA